MKSDTQDVARAGAERIKENRKNQEDRRADVARKLATYDNMRRVVEAQNDIIQRQAARVDELREQLAQIRAFLQGVVGA